MAERMLQAWSLWAGLKLSQKTCSFIFYRSNPSTWYMHMKHTAHVRSTA